MLRFAAEHRLVLAEHVAALLGASERSCTARLRALCANDLMSGRTVFHRQPAIYQVTRQGLATIGSALAPPKLDVGCYLHDAGIAWLWLMAHANAFGPMHEVLSERRMRSWDGGPEGRREPLGVGLGGVGPRGRPRLHYPDLLLRGADAGTIAIELELSDKGRARREQILAGYGADSRVDLVLYLVARASLGRAIRSSAARLWVSSRIHVQLFTWGRTLQTHANALTRPARARSLEAEGVR